MPKFVLKSVKTVEVFEMIKAHKNSHAFGKDILLLKTSSADKYNPASFHPVAQLLLI